MTSDYETARAKAAARRAEKEAETRALLVTHKARSVLRTAGWDAGPQALMLAVVEHQMVLPRDVDKVFARVLELQANPNEGHVTLTEDELAKRTRIPTDVAKLIHGYVESRRATDPKATAMSVRDEVQVKYKHFVQDANFYITYWNPAQPVGNGKRAAKNGGGRVQEQPEKPAHPAARFEGQFTPPSRVEAVAAQESAEEEEAAAIYQIIPLANHRTRVVLDVECDAHVGHALMSSIGYVLQQQKAIG